MGRRVPRPRSALDVLRAVAVAAACVAVAAPEAAARAPTKATAVAPAEASALSGSSVTAAQCGFIGRRVPANVRIHSLDTPAFPGKPVCYLVMEPPGGLVEGETYPLLVLFHGLGSKPGAWFRKDGPHLQLEAAMRAGRMPKAIVAVPAGAAGYWVDWPDGAHPFATMVTRDFLGDVGRRYPVSQDARLRAAVGISMGGFGALSFALKHPEQFGSAVALSPTDVVYAVEDSPRRAVYRKAFGSDQGRDRRLKSVNPFHLVKRGRGVGQWFAVAYGSEEQRKFREGSERLVAKMRERGLTVVERSVPGGGHGWATTWNAQTMRWWIDALGAHLAAEPEPAP